MNKKTRYIATVIIAIAGLSLVSIPVVAIEFEHIKIEPYDEAKDSCYADDEDRLMGCISSNIPVAVLIYDDYDLIYCNEDCSHQIDKQLKSGRVEVIATNNQPDTANVSYYLKADIHTLHLS